MSLLPVTPGLTGDSPNTLNDLNLLSSSMEKSIIRSLNITRSSLAESGKESVGS